MDLDKSTKARLICVFWAHPHPNRAITITASIIHRTWILLLLVITISRWQTEIDGQAHNKRHGMFWTLYTVTSTHGLDRDLLGLPIFFDLLSSSVNWYDLFRVFSIIVSLTLDQPYDFPLPVNYAWRISVPFMGSSLIRDGKVSQATDWNNWAVSAWALYILLTFRPCKVYIVCISGSISSAIWSHIPQIYYLGQMIIVRLWHIEL